ncbi:MAG: ABC-type multidrug transport system ATPase component [Bacteroidetes bacterium]|nr:ABC-type multidrug transport system ATPase component [Bacteroidota bacterium]
MSSMTLALNGVTKEFNRRSIFRDVSFSLGSGESLAITGRNGSGKSTLVKIVCGLLSPTRGTIEYVHDGKMIEGEDVRNHIGLVSPYLQLYDEFSGMENLELLSAIRSDRTLEDGRIDEVLNDVGLWERRKDLLRTYSSGMKQRLKYAFAVVHRPDILILDEPTSNLDKDGIEMVTRRVREQQKSAILIVATNDADEATWCSKKVELGTHR